MKMWNHATGDCPGQELLAAFTLIAIRYCLAAALMTCLWPEGWRVRDGTSWRIALAIGFVYLVGNTLQVAGLIWATPAVSAFLTSLGGAWAPLLAFCWWRNPIGWRTWVGLTLAVAGVFVLSQQGSHGQTWSIGVGEILTLLASLVFSVQILLLDRFGRQAPARLMTLTLAAMSGLPSLLVAGCLAAKGPGLSAWLSWSVRVGSQPSVQILVIILTLFSTILAFHWMNKYQPLVPANRAALIYFLEPLFATVFSLLLRYDTWNNFLLVGGALIIGGNIVGEPSIWRARREK
jgi:drug/metabolite transporter (DMT)-like permease